MNKIYIRRITAVVSIAVTILFLTDCRNDNQQLSVECTINYIHDNMPYHDDDYVNSFSVYPRRLLIGCSIKNTSNKTVSIPFKSLQDTICSSGFTVSINHTDVIPIMVEELRYYDKFSIKPNETIEIDIRTFVYRYDKGKYAKMSLQDLLRLLNVEYEKDSNDKNLSENEMADVQITWNKNLGIHSDEKGNGNIQCGP